MNKLNKICVFCGSSQGNDNAILGAAVLLGQTFVKRDISLVYGAAKIGVMGAIANAVLDNRGKAIGIIPTFLKTKEVMHPDLTELYVTKDMHERKLMMQDMSDGFITLPGGFGTLEELFEVLTWQQLGLHKKPIGLLNINGFYDDLLGLLSNMVTSGFLSVANFELLLVDTTISGLLNKMSQFTAPPVPKWLKQE